MGLDAKIRFAPSTLYPRARCKKVGSHTWSPPSANVIIAMPSVAVRNAGLWITPLSVNGLAASLLGGWISDRLLRRNKSAHYLVSAVSLGLGIPAMCVALFASGRPMVVGIFVAEFLLLLNTGPLNAAVINSVGPHVRAAALAANIFIFHLLGDVPSAALIGYVSDKYSLQLAFLGPVIAIALSSAILFYGMRFAPPLRISEEAAASQVPSGASS